MSDLADAIKRLGQAQRDDGALQPRTEVGARSSSVGRGRTPSNQAGSGSINETDYSLRTYWPEQIIKSSDGLMVLRIKPIKSIAIEGGQQMTFQQPPVTP